MVTVVASEYSVLVSYDRRSLAQGAVMSVSYVCYVMFCVIDAKNASAYLDLCQFNLDLYET